MGSKLQAILAFIKGIFSKITDEDTLTYIKRLLGEFYEDVVEFVEYVIVELEKDPDLSGDTKKKLATIAVSFFVAKLPLPDSIERWLISWLIDHYVAKLRIAQATQGVDVNAPMLS